MNKNINIDKEETKELKLKDDNVSSEFNLLPSERLYSPWNENNTVLKSDDNTFIPYNPK